MLFIGEFFCRCMCGWLYSHFLRVSLRIRECEGLQCHRFEAKLISNLKVASVSAHINYSPHFFVFLFLPSSILEA